MSTTIPKTVWLMASSVLVLCGTIGAMVSNDRFSFSDDPEFQNIKLYCAASNRAVVEDVCEAYFHETGRTVAVQYGASQALLAQINLAHDGDLFIPADDSYLGLAASRNLIRSQHNVAHMQCVVVVSQGNPFQISSFRDLLCPDIRLVQAHPEAANVGRVTREVLARNGVWESLQTATSVFRTNVTEVANDVLVGAADAGIVYDTTLHSYPQLLAIRIPELVAAESQIAIGVIANSGKREAAEAFVRFATSAEHGMRICQNHGFHVSSDAVSSDAAQ